MEKISASGPAAFGSRLRRLVERLDREVGDIYRKAGVDFEPRWYGVFRGLLEGGPQSVGELASQLGVTHAAVSQVRSALEKAGLIRAEADPHDGRRQQLMLTAEGEAMAERMKPVWDAVAAATQELLAENAPDLLNQLAGLETGIVRRGVKARADDLMSAPAAASAA